MTSRPSDDAEGDGVGYRKPPRATRFTKGQSGNPAGRPRGRHREAPYEAVLGQMVTIREGGSKRSVTAAEAFLRKLAKRGMEGDSAAARASLAVIEEARSQHGADGIRQFVVAFVAPGSVTYALLPLRMSPGILWGTLILTVGICVLSGLLAVRRVLAADPAEVF